MRKESVRDDIGRAVIIPDGPAVADAPGTWDIIYTCGATPITPGGMIRFEIPYGFTPPQTAYATAIGYTTVQTSSSAAALSLHLPNPAAGLSPYSPWGLFIYARVDEGTLTEGDVVTLKYGKGDGTGLTNIGAVAQYFQADVDFAVAVDPDGQRRAPSGGFALASQTPPSLRVVGGAPDHLFVVVPSHTAPGSEMPVKITVRDREKNTVSKFAGALSIRLPDGREIQHRMSVSPG